MLTLYPSLMANMDDGHLIRSLECEPSIMRTPVELELMARCERLADELADELADRQTEAEMEKMYEIQLEQSEFRAQLIQEIIELCDKSGSKKDLVAAIKTALENSYVEL